MSKAHKRIVILSVAAIFLLVLPITVFTLQRQNDPRSRAQFAINLVAPVSDASVSGTDVTIAAQTDAVLGHHGMEFFIDGTSIGIDETAPYLIKWDSTTVLNGKHVLTAKEVNEENATGSRTSQAVSITIANNTTDREAAAIEAVDVQTVQDSFASIAWETDDKTTSQIIYSKEGETESKTTQPTTLLTDDHSVALTNLEPNTEYTYQVKSTDAAGNTTISEPESFVTTADANSTLGEWTVMSGWNTGVIHSTLMYTGEVLLWGTNTDGDGTKVWNPSTNAFTKIGISNDIFCTGHATLPDGRVFVAGGHISNNVGTKNLNIFNPATKTWSAGPTMREGRWYPTVSVLPDGRAVIMTGDVTSSDQADTPEIYNPATNSLSALTNIQTTTLAGYSATFPTGNNKVFTISYGNADMHILDADAKTWIYKGKALNSGGATAQYRPGKILMTGGRSGGSSDKKASLIDINQSSFSWRSIAPMAYARYYHNLVNLPDGKVLAVGGASTPSPSASSGPLATELWDPQNEQWTTVAPISVKRMYHSTAILLPDGRVLAAGGRNGSGEGQTAEIYSPPYLFRGARPTITNAPSSVNGGSTVTISTPDTANIGQVNLLTPASQTHTHDMNQQFVPLDYSIANGSLQLQIPDDTAVLPKGYYMLFIVNTSGVPSVAKWIKVTDEPLPTATPTKTPTPTLTPTPKPTTIPTLTQKPTTPAGTQPTATKTPFQTTIEFNVLLHGIGKSGDNTNNNALGNTNPIRKQRQAELTIYNSSNQVAATVSASMVYDASLGRFQGTAIIPNLSTDFYQITLRSDGYLRRLVPGIQNLSAFGQNKIPTVTLITGDTNKDNNITIIDYNRLLDCFSDLSTARNCDANKKLLTDLTDDGQVNQFDYNLFIREVAVQTGL